MNTISDEHLLAIKNRLQDTNIRLCSMRNLLASMLVGVDTLQKRSASTLRTLEQMPMPTPRGTPTQSRGPD